MLRRVVETTLLTAACAGCTEAPAAHDAGTLGADAVSADRVIVADDAGPLPSAPLSWSVRARGPFNVGYTSVSHSYTPPGASAPRTLTLHLWYPTRALSGPRPTYRRLFRDPESIVDAPSEVPVYPDGYPVHVYSHGHQGFGPTSHFLMRYFASHGWVAVAPDHTGNTISDTPSTLPASIFHLRARDVSASLDALRDGPLAATLSGRANVSRVLLSGHSAGVHTVWTAGGARFDPAAVEARCMTNPCTALDRAQFAAGVGDARVVAGLAMAGALRREWLGPTGHGGVRFAMFAMSGGDDPVGAEAQFESTAPMPMTWIDVRGGCHQYFALGGCENIADTEQAPIVGAYALAYARRMVLNDTDPTVGAILEGASMLSDRVTFRRRVSP